MARMALRAYRPFAAACDDPMDISDDTAAVQQFEEFMHSPQCFRWLRARYEHHNTKRGRKLKRPAPGEGAASCGGQASAASRQADALPSASSAEPPRGTGSTMVESDGDDDGAFLLCTRQFLAAQFDMRWNDSDQTCLDQPFSVVIALQHADNRRIPIAYVKAMIEALRPGSRIPQKKLTCMEFLTRCILQLDLEPFEPKSRGVGKASITNKALREVAGVWRKYHPMEQRAVLQSVAESMPYAVLWMNLKRLVLKEFGFVVVTAPSRRIYFEEPTERPRLAPSAHAPAKEGKWREPVRISSPYAACAADDDVEEEQRRSKSYVRNAADEQAFGRGSVPGEEVPLPVDDEALQCPDMVAKAEWDAVWPYDDLVRVEAIHAETPVEELRDGDPRLMWTLPERAGGLSDVEYATLCQQSQGSEEAPPPEALDPTQRAFAEMAVQWKEGARRSFLALLLGTAGTGKTTTLKCLIRELKSRGLRKVVVGAYTGVAASNVGLGARTLTDLFRLAKVNEASGELIPLEGDDIDAFIRDLEGLELLVIDEISMVSSVLLHQIHSRLREWRLACGDGARACEPFGGIAVILAGDFGQLPPVAVAASLSLLNSDPERHGREQKTANHGKRLFLAFDTVVRLRRIHRQPGASQYKESLIRTRDGAMTKDDHELWAQHNLTDADACTLTEAQRVAFNRLPHLFAENAGAGERNGIEVGQEAARASNFILRVASQDTSGAAAQQPQDNYGQLRRVLHLTRGAPVMLLANLRTRANLVNGAMGTLVAAELKPRVGSGTSVLPKSVAATDIRYVIVDIPKYTGPAFFTEHPTWVAVRPLPVRHKRIKKWERVQLPLALAYGITIHKSQGLTFADGVVVDFAHQPSYQPVARMGLAFVAMSRCTAWAKQAFRNLPGFWEFRKVLQEPLFKWRAAFEERMDVLHDDTMAQHKGRAWTTDDDVDAHMQWSEGKLGRHLEPEELEDLRTMLSVRGVLPAPQYDDEPSRGASGLRGGGGKRQRLGMRPQSAAQRGRSVAVAAATQAVDEDDLDEAPADAPAPAMFNEPPDASNEL
jgi:hypothetical protein